jgi:hypothetical protein
MRQTGNQPKDSPLLELSFGSKDSCWCCSRSILNAHRADVNTNGASYKRIQNKSDNLTDFEAKHKNFKKQNKIVRVNKFFRLRCYMSILVSRWITLLLGNSALVTQSLNSACSLTMYSLFTTNQTTIRVYNSVKIQSCTVYTVYEMKIQYM